MAEYHVGCGIDKIFAGTLTKGGKYWRQNSDVTDEAIIAVIQHMYFQLDKGETSMAYAIKLNDGKYARLKLEVSDKCPEWAKEILEAEDDETDCDYERAVEQLEHDMLYEPTFNPDDGSM